MANWLHCPSVERHAQRNGGLWVFKGTDVPLYRLYEHLAAGGTVGNFSEHWGVVTEQVVAMLNYEADELHDYRLDHPDGVPFLRAPNREYNAPDDAHWHDCPVVEQDSGRLGGVWVFLHTRLPVHVLHYNLAGGATVDEFVEWFAGDMRKTIAVLEHEAATLREAPVVYADTV